MSVSLRHFKNATQEQIIDSILSNPEFCVSVCRQSLRVDPNEVQSYLVLSEALCFLGQNTSAQKSYLKAHELSTKTLSLRSRMNQINSMAKSCSSQDTIRSYRSLLGDEEIALFFTPDINVSPHFSAQCIIAKVLQEQEVRAVFLPFGELFHPFQLPSIESVGSWFSNETVRQYNQQIRAQVFSYLGKYNLASLTPYAFFDVREIQNIKESIPFEGKHLLNYEYDGILFGKLSLLDLALITKRLEFESISGELSWVWSKFITHNVLAYLILKSIYSRFNIKYAFHYGDYSPMLTHRIVAQKFSNASLFSISHISHMGVDRQRFSLHSGTFRETALRQNEYWHKFRDVPLPQSIVNEIGDDLISRLSSSNAHVYSPAKTTAQSNLRAKLNLDPAKPLLVAYTSSLDEFTAAKMGMEECLEIKLPQRVDPFENQIDWLKHLTEFVESRSDIQLVVRIHPRESKNKRESAVSQHLKILLENFSEDFKNSRFVWPEEPISSYDLAEIADLVLTSWSTIGLECARLGIPVLTAIHGISPFPHDDFLEWSDTRSSYFEKLLSMLNKPTSLGTVSRAFRCYHLFQMGTSLDFSDVVPNKGFMGLPQFKLPHVAVDLLDVIAEGKDILDVNLRKLSALQKAESGSTEERAIIEQLRRIFHFMFTGEDTKAISDNNVRFKYAPLVESAEGLKEYALGFGSHGHPVVFFAASGSEVFYLTVDGKVLQRFSPLCARLIPLIVHHT